MKYYELFLLVVLNVATYLIPVRKIHAFLQQASERPGVRNLQDSDAMLSVTS